MNNVKISNRIMLFYPPGRMFMRGEERCQVSISASSAGAMRACNDIGYAASVLIAKNYDVFLKDYQTEKKTVAQLREDVLNFKPDLMVFTTTNGTIFEDIEIIKELKPFNHTKLAINGAIFFDAPDIVLSQLDLNDIDFLFGGEMETIIGKLADCIFRNIGTLDEIDNLVYKLDGNFHKTTFGIWCNDLDNIPFPARNLMNNKLYVRPDTNETMATIQISRGCPSQCIYCLSPHISGNRVRFRSPQNVFDEICECFYIYNIHSFFFRADTFTINEKWVKDLCELIINSTLNNKIEFTANSRVSPLTIETLRIMKKAGCYLVVFGFETGNEETLTRIKKGTTLDQARLAVKYSKEVGLQTYGFFILGFPWENINHIKDTERLIFELNCDFIEISFAEPFYSTELYDLCVEKKLIDKSILGTDYFCLQANGTEFLTNKQLVKMRDHILIRYYLRPSYIIKKFFGVFRKPIILINYSKYGIRLLKNLLFQAK